MVELRSVMPRSVTNPTHRRQHVHGIESPAQEGIRAQADGELWIIAQRAYAMGALLSTARVPMVDAAPAPRHLVVNLINAFCQVNNFSPRLPMILAARYAATVSLAAVSVGLAARAAHAQRTDVSADAPALSMTPGRAVVPLVGPWRFHTGDDPRWAEPGLDDASWETVDLTPRPGAHDPDVGLEGYVRGWGARGHRGYSGYAWYRLRVSVTGADTAALALAAPLEVDEAYQLFVNGRLAGSSGRFGGATPVVYNTRPALYSLAGAASPPNARLVIAVRVWAGPEYMREVPDGGGIRIAPALGGLRAIHAQVTLDWLAKFLGYVVDAAVAAAFLALAAMALGVGWFRPADRAYGWLAIALVLTAVARANQAVFYWTTWESARTAILVRFAFADPLGLGAWAMAWRSWFGVDRPAWLPRAVAALTICYLLTNVTAAAGPPSITRGALLLGGAIRIAFVAVMALIAYPSVSHATPREWLALAAMLLVSIGLYAQEVSALRVPGIWFPFGVGVSRTQFAYAAFVLAAFAMLLRRLASYARAGQPARTTIRLHAAFD